MFRLFVCVLLLIVSVKTNPVPQNCPETYCDQTTYRNLLSDSPDTNYPSLILPLNQITEYEKINKIDKIYKLFNERLANNPSALHIVKNLQGLNNEDILNYIRNSGNIPNIVNNYIFLPLDAKTENVLKQNNINSRSFNKIKSQYDRNKKNTNKRISSTPCNSIGDINKEAKIQTPNIDQTVSKNMLEKTNETNEHNEDNIRKTLKRSLEEKGKSINRDNIKKNLNQNEGLFNSNSPDDIQHENTINTKKKSSNKKRRKDKSKQTPERALSKINIKENNTEKSLSIKKNNATHVATQNQGSNLKKTVKKIKNNESDQKKHTKEKYQNKDAIQNKSKKNNDRANNNFENNNPLVGNDFNDMYKYIDALLSNYQLTNSNFNSVYPFDYNNFYQLSQPSSPWNNINSLNNNVMPHKHRKLQRLHGKRLNKKRSKLRKKQKGKKVDDDDQMQNLNSHNDLSKDRSKSGKKEESVSLTDIDLKNSNMKYLEESEINSTKLYEESTTTNNNSITKESSSSSHYNSYPSFIIGMEDTVPIIFEDGFIDDYYPDFTADNKALSMHQDENISKMYNSNKYRYVSNHNLDLEDYIQKRKELAMHNVNTNTKLFFSEKATNGDVIISEEDVTNKEGDRMIQFQSPPLLDNPDFRTRKVESESGEKFEPYYYHNVFHDPDEDFNKYYSEKKEIVYPTSYSLKNDVDNKLCNAIDDSSSKAKWKKIKDSNVETVYARSKLAKYGLVL